MPSRQHMIAAARQAAEEAQRKSDKERADQERLRQRLEAIELDQMSRGIIPRTPHGPASAALKAKLIEARALSMMGERAGTRGADADLYQWIHASDLISAIKAVFGEDRDSESGYIPPTPSKVSRAKLPKRGSSHYEPIAFGEAFEWACEQYASGDAEQLQLRAAMIAVIEARE